jgi:hypothetical protein
MFETHRLKRVYALLQRAMAMLLIMRSSRWPPQRVADARKRAYGGLLTIKTGFQNLPYTGTMPLRVTAFSGEARNMIVAATSSTFGHAA